LGKRGI